MSKNFDYLFSLNSLPKPSNSLFGRVMERINKEIQLVAIKRRVAIFSVSAAISAWAFLWALQAAELGFAQSGFARFFYLLFSDFGSVAAYWNNFAFSLLEALPSTSLILLLAFVWAFIYSLNRLAKDMKNIFNYSHIRHTL
ncbi:MAG: hypothetical protein UX10_C0004G0036 [Candidatus Magasanikbacteria bacterium GW2011_GWA2_45_39]|uniref:Uncharacterized protein n=1 Tax=Candidatus Magasanikbacteria bacterium GW2011_GWA2_45_39 TaxID=1619041 RepID=A0A0G1PR22_9BACT|nr:MAG: hypothetical protein UX10_C0004G0036 [Candidatus Magasanikbacteria bacterium GW2011_GWA2_45_39]HBW74167.1 hypothetical protein [Candidatus Magasanikbacteria bacterium]